MTFGYWLFLLMIIPVAAGVFAWIKFHTIDIRESGVGIAAALVTISMVLGLSKCSNQRDTETHSGKVEKAVHIPKWEAEWIELVTHYSTDSKGNTTSYTVPETKRETHYPKWWVETTLGRYDIEPWFFDQISEKHGISVEKGYRPDYDSGDRNDYISYVNDDPEFCDYPVTKIKTWMNPLKNSKTLHNYQKISKEEAQKMGLPNYPDNATFSSSRIIGDTAIDIWNWDKMNSALGPQKHVNLILVKTDSIEKAKYIQAHWQNGKKNDLVICHGGTKNASADWCYVFGWSKSELVKQNIQTLFLTNPVNDDILKELKAIVRKDFQSHEWTMYKDTDFLIPTGWVIAAFIILTISQVGLYYFFHQEQLFP